MEQLKIYRTLFCETWTGRFLGTLQLGLPTLAFGIIGIISIINYDRHLSSVYQAVGMAGILFTIIIFSVRGFLNGLPFFPQYCLKWFIARNQALIAQKAKDRITYLEELLEKDFDLFVGFRPEHEEEIADITAEITFLKEHFS